MSSCRHNRASVYFHLLSVLRFRALTLGIATSVGALGPNPRRCDKTPQTAMYSQTRCSLHPQIPRKRRRQEHRRRYRGLIAGAADDKNIRMPVRALQQYTHRGPKTASLGGCASRATRASCDDRARRVPPVATGCIKSERTLTTTRPIPPTAPLSLVVLRARRGRLGAPDCLSDAGVAT